MFKKKGIIICI